MVYHNRPLYTLNFLTNFIKKMMSAATKRSRSPSSDMEDKKKPRNVDYSIHTLEKAFKLFQASNDENADFILKRYETTKAACTTDTKPDNLTIILLEGLDASGKSTIAEQLRTLDFNMVFVYKTPPSSVGKYRAYFDKQTDTLFRRSYYLIANYIAHYELFSLATMLSNEKIAVIMDRFYPSTIVYGHTEEFRDIASPQYMNIEWPEDLIKPDTIIYTKCDKKVRDTRLIARKDELTAEERRLIEDPDYENFLSECYRYFFEYINLPVITIDTSENPNIKTVLMRELPEGFLKC